MKLYITWYCYSNNAWISNKCVKIINNTLSSDSSQKYHNCSIDGMTDWHILSGTVVHSDNILCANKDKNIIAILEQWTICFKFKRFMPYPVWGSPFFTRHSSTTRLASEWNSILYLEVSTIVEMLSFRTQALESTCNVLMSYFLL